ncbi:MAG: MerR family transcriptional regulator [Magnetococcales bacterium]|nr:MerR family transcriptional regulator [Magnetococcales bacterium]
MRRTKVSRTKRPGGGLLTVEDVAAILGVAPHVLRAWEQAFPQARPVGRVGGRRLYRWREVDLFLRIRRLLRERRLTIARARELLGREAAQSAGAILLREVRRDLLELHRFLTRPGVAP